MGEPIFIHKFEEVVPQPINDSVTLRRYLNLPKFVSLLVSGKLYLTRSDVFSDPLEGSVTRLMAEALKEQFNDKLHVVLELADFRRLSRESTFVNCWSFGDSESVAMWNLYCESVYGVAIQTTYKKLRDSLPEEGFNFAPVRYINYQTDGFPQSNLIYPFFHKRDVYEYEQEVRVVRFAFDQLVMGLPSTGKETTEKDIQRLRAVNEEKERIKAQRGKGITIEWPAADILSAVLVHPYSPEWFFDVVKSVANRLSPDLEERVEWSAIRTDPIF